jgi:hypothetical protein
MRWLLDSNVWIEAIAGIPYACSAVVKAGSVEWCGFSSITRLEVFGFPNLTSQDEQRLIALLAQFREAPVSSLVIDEAIRIRRRVKVNTPDALIAATALVESARLVTRNTSDFAHIAGLTVVDPVTL